MRTCKLFLSLAIAAAWLAPSAGAAVTVGHSGWFWGNPLPQGEALVAVDFAGERGYASGSFGTLLRTDDFGTSWTGLSTGVTATLASLSLIDSDSLVVGGGCSARRSDDGGVSFRRLPFTGSERSCTAELQALDFPTSDVGYLMLRTGAVLRTADAGSTFAQRTALPGSRAAAGSSDVSALAFLSQDTGFATTHALGQGRIYRTTDGGGSWTLVGEADRRLFGLYFLDATTGFAVGDGGLLLATSDGGATWALRPLTGAPVADLRSIRCDQAAATCLIATVGGEQLIRTTDGGENGAAVTPATTKVFAVAFGNAARAVAVGQNGTTVISDTAGTTFASVGGILTGTFSNLRSTSPASAEVLGEAGALARTTDGGQTWAAIGVPTSANLVDVSFPTAGTGFAVDAEGTVLRTDSGGASWQILSAGEFTPAALVAPTPETVLMIGPRGIRRSTDGGNAFEPLNARLVKRAAVSNFDTAGGALFAFGREALLYSGNSGRTWSRVKLPRRRRIAEVDFVSSRVGYLLDSTGGLYRTRNRGKAWEELLTLGTRQGYEMAFGDSRNGWVAITDFGAESAGFVLRTSDGGRSWRPQLVGSVAIRQDGLSAPSGGAAFALGLSNRLWATATGGDAGQASQLAIKASAKRVKKSGVVTISGTLKPPEGGEEVVVARRSAGRWETRVLRVTGRGTFTTDFRLRRTSLFVAQWRGDDNRAGAGTRAREVDVGPPPKPKKKRKRRRR